MAGSPRLAALPDAQVAAEEKRLFEDLLRRDGAENPYDLRRELRRRDGPPRRRLPHRRPAAAGLEKVREIRSRFDDIHLKDRGRIYNSNLFHVLELENLLDLAEVMITGALAREESRGGHARRDFPVRDDDKFLQHTLVWKEADGVDVWTTSRSTITQWKPVERKY